MVNKGKINITSKLQGNLWTITLLCLVFWCPPAEATYVPFNTSVTGNIGIGTTNPQGGLVVTNGNVGIGTWSAAGGNLIVNGGGNVGIGSAWPGQALDVSGTVRMISGIDTGNLMLTQVTETVVNLGATLSGTVTLNLANGTYFYGTITGPTTFAVSNYASSGYGSSFTLELTNGGSQTITWMSGTKWPGGLVPTLTSSGVDLIVCSTRDGATTWRCVVSELNSQ